MEGGEYHCLEDFFSSVMDGRWVFNRIKNFLEKYEAYKATIQHM
jgi:hypothetical protein